MSESHLDRIRTAAKAARSSGKEAVSQAVQESETRSLAAATGRGASATEAAAISETRMLSAVGVASGIVGAALSARAAVGEVRDGDYAAAAIDTASSVTFAAGAAVSAAGMAKSASPVINRLQTLLPWTFNILQFGSASMEFLRAWRLRGNPEKRESMIGAVEAGTAKAIGAGLSIALAPEAAAAGIAVAVACVAGGEAAGAWLEDHPVLAGHSDPPPVEPPGDFDDLTSMRDVPAVRRPSV